MAKELNGTPIGEIGIDRLTIRHKGSGFTRLMAKVL